MSAMETTRRLSLTLLLVAPLIRAQDNLTPDLSLGSSVSGEHLPDGNRPSRPHALEYDDQEEVGTSTTVGSVTISHPEVVHGRERRQDISSLEEDMEVAEQVVFRPLFRHRQIQDDRKADQDEAQRKQSLLGATASGQPYYPYQQYNSFYPF